MSQVLTCRRTAHVTASLVRTAICTVHVYFPAGLAAGGSSQCIAAMLWRGANEDRSKEHCGKQEKQLHSLNATKGKRSKTEEPGTYTSTQTRSILQQQNDYGDFLVSEAQNRRRCLLLLPRVVCSYSRLGPLTQSHCPYPLALLRRWGHQLSTGRMRN